MTIFFPDVSHWNDGVDVTGAVALAAKATQGTGYTDPTYAAFKARAAALGIPFIAYHWLDTTDAGAQARHAYDVVGPNVPLMIDDEQGVIAVAHTLAFVAAYRALGGRVVLEYAPAWVWAGSGQPDLRPLTAAGLAIVSSNYPTGGYSDTGPGWAAYGGVSPTVWQYTDKQSFGGRPVDFNAFRGSAEQLRRLITGAQPEEDDVLVKTLSWGGKVWLWVPGVGMWWIPGPDIAGKVFAQFPGLTWPAATLESLGWTAALVDQVYGPVVASLRPGGVALTDAQLAELRGELRDAVADVAEGGAAAVRAEAP